MRISDWSADVCSSDLDFGALREPFIKLAVAVILFEGGLTLKFRELRHAGVAVFMLVFVGVPVGWALGTAAAYYGAGLSLEIAATSEERRVGQECVSTCRYR